jgi:hypothetical protein
MKNEGSMHLVPAPAVNNEREEPAQTNSRQQTIDLAHGSPLRPLQPSVEPRTGSQPTSTSMQGTVYDERLSILKNDLSAEYLRRFQLPGLLTLDAFFRALVTVER